MALALALLHSNLSERAEKGSTALNEMRPTLLAVFGAVIGACLAGAGQAQTLSPDGAALAATGIL